MLDEAALQRARAAAIAVEDSSCLVSQLWALPYAMHRRSNRHGSEGLLAQDVADALQRVFELKLKSDEEQADVDAIAAVNRLRAARLAPLLEPT